MKTEKRQTTEFFRDGKEVEGSDALRLEIAQRLLVDEVMFNSEYSFDVSSCIWFLDNHDFETFEGINKYFDVNEVVSDGVITFSVELNGLGVELLHDGKN